MKKFVLTLSALMVFTSLLSIAHACPSLYSTARQMVGYKQALKKNLSEMNGYSTRTAKYEETREDVISLTEELNRQTDAFLSAVDCHERRGQIKAISKKDAVLEAYEVLGLFQMYHDQASTVAGHHSGVNSREEREITKRAYKAIGRSKGALKIVRTRDVMQR